MKGTLKLFEKTPKPSPKGKKLPKCDVPTFVNGPCTTEKRPRRPGASVHYTKSLNGKPCAWHIECEAGVKPGADLRRRKKKRR